MIVWQMSGWNNCWSGEGTGHRKEGFVEEGLSHFSTRILCKFYWSMSVCIVRAVICHLYAISIERHVVMLRVQLLLLLLLLLLWWWRCYGDGVWLCQLNQSPFTADDERYIAKDAELSLLRDVSPYSVFTAECNNTVSRLSVCDAGVPWLYSIEFHDNNYTLSSLPSDKEAPMCSRGIITNLQVEHEWYTVWVKKSPCGFQTFSPNSWEFLINFYTPITRSYLR